MLDCFIIYFSSQAVSALDNGVMAEIGVLYAQMGQMADGEVDIFREGLSPVHTALGDHLDVWEREGAGVLRTGVFREGLRLQPDSVPDKYHEDNNLSL